MCVVGCHKVGMVYVLMLLSKWQQKLDYILVYLVAEVFQTFLRELILGCCVGPVS